MIKFFFFYSLSQPFSAMKSILKYKKKKAKRLIEPIKRPQGMHREVWGLICKDDHDQPPLIPTQEPKIYKHPKAKLRHGVRKWHWIGFKNPARGDTATFYHWRCVNDDPNKEYPFAKFNKVFG
jgi:DNA methyltransferase 1-associated protein 1